MRELTFHKGLTSPDSCSDHLGSSGFWPFHHRKSEQRVTVICVCDGGGGRAKGRSEIPSKSLVLGRYVYPCIGELSLKLVLRECLRRPI